MPVTTFVKLWDQLLAEGVVSTTPGELAYRAGTTMGAALRAVHDAKKKGILFSPSKGLYVLVPPEYRAWGVVPASWYIDDMMRHLGRRYYVSLLTAAGEHGASHHASQVHQVMVDGRLSDRTIGGVKLRFYLCRDMEGRAVTKVSGPTGNVTVATPETCVLDMAERPDDAGGLNLILEVVAELSIDSRELVKAARTRPRAVVRRCGWILAQTHPELDLDGLRREARPEARNPSPLVPSAPHGELDRDWGVVVDRQAVDVP